MQYRIFDCWRLMAAVLIMAYHFLYSAPYGAEAGTAFLYRLLPLLDMFFMISGFFIAGRYSDKVHTTGDYFNFMRRRIARLYPLHLAMTTFFVGVAIAAWAVNAPNYPWAHDLAALPQHILVLHALGTTDGLALNYVSWSVSAEVFSYALFPVLLFVLRKRGLSGLVLLLAVWVAGLETASRLGFFPSGHWTSADSFGAYRAFADFTTGAIIAVLVSRRIVDIRSHWPGLVLMAAAVVMMVAQVDVYLELALLAGALITTALAETARPASTDILKPLMPISRVAFGIYLIHPMMEFVFLTVIWNRWLEPLDVVDFYVFWTVPMVATIVIALLSERFFERRVGQWIAGPRRDDQRKNVRIVSA